MNPSTKLDILDHFHIIPVMHTKTATLRRYMKKQGIQIRHIWPARQFYKLRNKTSNIVETTEAYGYDIWPLFIECNAVPEQIVKLHKEILDDKTIPDNIKIHTKDESRTIIKRKESLEL